MNRRQTMAMLTTVGIGAAALPAQTAFAKIETIPAATISVGGGYSSNPFLSSGSDTSAASGQLSVVPSLQLIDGTDQAIISANYNRTEYLSKYHGNDGYGIDISGSSQLSARTSLSLSAGYDSSILGSAGAFAITPVGTTPVLTGTTDTGTTTGSTTGTATGVTQVIDPLPIGAIGGDIGLIGLRQRRTTISASAGASFRPDERSTWTFGGSASRTNYPNNNGFATSYRTYGLSTSYTRSLSEKTSVGFSVSGTAIDYALVPDSRILSPRLTYSRLLAERWTLNLSAGASYVDDGFGSSIAASASGSACRRDQRGQLCLTASHEPSVSAFGGARNQTSLGASYSYQLAEATSIAASASYQHVGNGATLNGAGALVNRSQEYYSTDISLNRRISRRVSAYVSASYRDVNGLGVPVKGDFGARAGLSLSVGGRQ